MSKVSVKLNQIAKAFAPATVGNIAVGYDILGFCAGHIGDTISVIAKSSHNKNSKIFIESIGGELENIPQDLSTNTASVALKSMIDDLKIENVDFYMSINKGISAGSGLGSSAASSVASVVAANALLVNPLSKQQLFDYALEGEKISSNCYHADNIAPCLFGGITLSVKYKKYKNILLPVADVFCSIIQPKLQLKTIDSRAKLANTVNLYDFTRQSSYLAHFIACLYEKNIDELKNCLRDIVIEPQRKSLIPGFDKAKQAALDIGALGFSISGSGPCVFAWSPTKEVANNVAKAVSDIFATFALESKIFVGVIDQQGARLV